MQGLIGFVVAGRNGEQKSRLAQREAAQWKRVWRVADVKECGRRIREEKRSAARCPDEDPERWDGLS